MPSMRCEIIDHELSTYTMASVAGDGLLYMMPLLQVCKMYIMVVVIYKICCYIFRPIITCKSNSYNITVGEISEQ